jgi:hypothetical protein
MANVHRFTIQLRRPSGDDPGAVEYGAYIVDGSMVVLTNAEGEPLRREGRLARRGDPDLPTDYSRKLRPGEEAIRVARELLMQKYRATKRGSDFNRPLRFPPVSVA